MHEFHTRIDIEAAPPRVWAVMTDVERWPEWTASVTEVRQLDDGPLSPGSRVRIRQPKLRPAVWQVTELDEGRSFAWVTRSPGVRVTARHVIEAAGDRSRVTLSVQYEGPLAPLVARITRGLNERYLRLEAEGLKARSEQ